MRKSDTQKINEVITEYLKSLKISGKMKEIRLIKSWEEVVGKTIARSTEKIYIKDKKLYVYLKSAVVRNELMMLRNDLVKALNSKVNENIIKEIILK